MFVLLREMEETFGTHLRMFTALYGRAKTAAGALDVVRGGDRSEAEESGIGDGRRKLGKKEALERARRAFAAGEEGHPKAALGEWKEDPALLLLEELVDCVALLALRSKQVRMLYESKDLERADSQVRLGD